MTAAERSPVVLHADPEHSGIRAAVFLSLFFAFVLAFWIVSWLFEALAPQSLLDYTTFLSCVGALPLALLMVYGLEKLLRRTWHSGLSLILDDRGLYVRDRKTGQGMAADWMETPSVDWTKPVALTNWYFRVGGYPRGGRERRVEKNWLCVASQLQQEDAKLVVYCFMPPAKAEALTADRSLGFHAINPAELYDVNMRSRIGPPTRPTIPNNLLHSKDGRYWLAERRRWEFGVELTPDDFATYLDYAQKAERHSLQDSAAPTDGA